MKKNPCSSMVIIYQRCNAHNDQFQLQDWKSSQADVLWVALVLDRLPASLTVRFSQLANKHVVYNPNETSRYFLTQVPEESKFEFKDVITSPFLPETGLQDLTVKLKFSWERLTLRVEFPVGVVHLETLKSRGVW
ncbi:MAG: hypothetical protein ACQEW9_07030 [Bacteroidota bacterium]